MKLTPENVETIFTSSLFDSEADTSNAIIVEGIQTKFGFDPVKIEDNKKTISAMLDELPDEFKLGKGGGWSFLNACYDKNGNQWTGLQSIMDQLFCLGMAIGKVKLLMPREMWGILPGGMPYYQIIE